ncbi:FUSC family protein [Winogradskya humida]|uniref:Integral membrane bound transporter domain-containing protein n=1 Tax=Winogradskya humida TaxID=113566 RepID=A0ABQ3ZJ73_9ACTN|nr:FUSC family protein [Actinoplanes humidus]GIE18639.1 hypothetical protein Ahu01nite_017410 [Actinoplanes humidus]
MPQRQPPRPGRDLLRHSVRSTPLGGPLLLAALRVAVGALAAGSVAGALAHITGLGHAYWAAVSAVAVLQSTNLLVTVHRGVQRAAGTVAGLLVAVAVLAVPGGTWPLVALTACTRTTDELTAAPTRELARRLAVNLMVLREAYEIASGEPALPPGTTELVLATERRARSALATAT